MTHIHRCGCHQGNQLDVTTSIKVGRDDLEYPEYRMKIENHEPKQKVFATLVTIEDHDGTKDRDTFPTRNIPLDPGCSTTLRLAKNGNGIQPGTEFNIVLKNCRRDVLGVIEGAFPEGRCHGGPQHGADPRQDGFQTGPAQQDQTGQAEQTGQAQQD